MENEDLLSTLSRYLPDDPHEYTFGTTKSPTAADAESKSKKRATPLISVYVVSNNNDQVEWLAKIWKAVPSRFFVLTEESFFSKEGLFLGVDRLATLMGAADMYGHPALVFDGGSKATTYFATDGEGNILGGGIGPGIMDRLLLEITPEEVIARVKEAHEKGRPLPIFARDEKEEMIADACRDVALKCRNVIEQWLREAPTKRTTRRVNRGRRVFVGG